MLRKICNHPSCNALIDTTERYCPEHRVESESKPFSKAVRYNSALYATSRWRNLRKAILKENPRCERCGIGQDEASIHAHHIIPPRGNEELFSTTKRIWACCARAVIGPKRRERQGGGVE